jgi:diamine N-acetyltransferase
VMRRGHHRLTVCYHAGQHGPEDFYRRLGFHATGEYNEGETVAERLLAAR